MFFSVELPEYLVPDNYFASALFECIDIYINHELISAKASNADNYLTDYFIQRQLYNEPFSNSANEISGVFNDKNLDASEFSSVWTNSRRKIAQEITKANGTKFYRYELYLPINHGLGLCRGFISNKLKLKFSSTGDTSTKWSTNTDMF